MSVVEPPPVRAARVPHASAPVRLPEVRKAQASYIANLVTGAVLFVFAVSGLAAFFLMGLAS